MDRKAIMMKNPGEWSEEEQLVMIEQTDNSLSPQDQEIKQPPQDPDYAPDSDEVVDSIE